MTDARQPWDEDFTTERWDAVEPHEREAFLRYGLNPAPWESPPAFAARILKADPKMSLDNGAKLAIIFRSAYESMVSP